MKRLQVGILDLVTNTPREARFHSHVMAPNLASIMPQSIGVWAEQLGCEVHYETFTGREDLLHALPGELDILFVSSFTRASFLAYGLSHHFRDRGTVTVLGGPHARSFPEHARPHFDYVCRFTDKDLVRELLEDCAPHSPGVVLGAAGQPRTLPGLRDRMRFVDHGMRKATRLFRAIPMLGSLGCPYSCEFCVDAPVRYGAFEVEQLVDDLRAAQARYGEETIVGWHDPNFGVRFDEMMAAIDGSGTRLMHVAESSLSLLKEPRIRALAARRFVGMLPGIESWFGHNAKSGARSSGEEKLDRVSAQMELIAAHVPMVQANFVLGLDDEPEAAWELTKRFVDQVPAALPGYSLVTDFGNSPLSAKLEQAGRTLAVPYPLLDNNFAVNVRLSPPDTLAFYDRLIDLFEHTWSWRASERRFRANERFTVKLLNFGRALTEGRGRLAHHRRIRERLARDRGFLAFTQGELRTPPLFYFEEIRRGLGRYAELVPPALLTPEGFLRSVDEARAETEAASTSAA